jgi:hypothetical protein
METTMTQIQHYVQDYVVVGTANDGLPVRLPMKPSNCNKYGVSGYEFLERVLENLPEYSIIVTVSDLCTMGHYSFPSSGWREVLDKCKGITIEQYNLIVVLDECSADIVQEFLSIDQCVIFKNSPEEIQEIKIANPYKINVIYGSYAPFRFRFQSEWLEFS